MGPGPPPRRPVPLSGSAGTARSSLRWGQPRLPGVSAPGLEQVSGEDGWSPRHAGLGSARPWGLGFSTVGSWGESRGCLSVDGSSGSWGPHLRPPPPPSCRPPTAYVRPAFVRPRSTRVSILQAPAGPRGDHGVGEGDGVHAETGHSGRGRGHKARTPDPPAYTQHALRGNSRLNPTQPPTALRDPRQKVRKAVGAGLRLPWAVLNPEGGQPRSSLQGSPCLPPPSGSPPSPPQP